MAGEHVQSNVARYEVLTKILNGCMAFSTMTLFNPGFTVQPSP